MNLLRMLQRVRVKWLLCAIPKKEVIKLLKLAT